MGAANPEESQSLSMGIDGERFKMGRRCPGRGSRDHPAAPSTRPWPRSSRAARSGGSSPRASRAARRSSPEAGRRRDGGCRRGVLGPARPVHKTPQRGDARRVGHVLDDRGQQAAVPRRREGRSPRPTATGPAMPSGISKTAGKEDELFSPFLRKPFKRAVAGRPDPEEPDHARRHVGDHHPTRAISPTSTSSTWPEIDGDERRRPDSRRDRRPPAGDAGDQGAPGVHARAARTPSSGTSG